MLGIAFPSIHYFYEVDNIDFTMQSSKVKVNNFISRYRDLIANRRLLLIPSSSGNNGFMSFQIGYFENIINMLILCTTFGEPPLFDRCNCNGIIRKFVMIFH